jgi:hypothetical protein
MALEASNMEAGSDERLLSRQGRHPAREKWSSRITSKRSWASPMAAPRFTYGGLGVKTTTLAHPRRRAPAPDATPDNNNNNNNNNNNDNAPIAHGSFSAATTSARGGVVVPSALAAADDFFLLTSAVYARVGVESARWRQPPPWPAGLPNMRSRTVVVAVPVTAHNRASNNNNNNNRCRDAAVGSCAKRPARFFSCRKH